MVLSKEKLDTILRSVLPPLEVFGTLSEAEVIQLAIELNKFYEKYRS